VGGDEYLLLLERERNVSLMSFFFGEADITYFPRSRGMRYESCVWNETVAYNLEIRWVEGGDLFERGADWLREGVVDGVRFKIRGRGGRAIGGLASEEFLR